MKAVIIRIAQFFRIVDDQNNLSLTNLGVYVALVKMATTTNPSFADIGIFITSAVAYNYKKWLNNSNGN